MIATIPREGNTLRRLKRILLAAALSWGYSVTLGLIFAARASGHFSLGTLRLPWVIPVALLGSTVVAIALTPLAIWAVRTGGRNLSVFGPILWLALAGYIAFAIPRLGQYGLDGLLLIAAFGLAALGFVPGSR